MERERDHNSHNWCPNVALETMFIANEFNQIEERLSTQIKKALIAASREELVSLALENYELQGGHTLKQGFDEEPPLYEPREARLAHPPSLVFEDVTLD